MRLAGRRVLITGAAGGIGGAIAREFVARGCAVTVTGRRERDLERLVRELGPSARGYIAELTKLEEARELLARADPIDVLVANAGVEIPQDLAVVSEAELEEAIRINLLAPAALARAALAPMKKRERVTSYSCPRWPDSWQHPATAPYTRPRSGGYVGWGSHCDKSCTAPVLVCPQSFPDPSAVRGCSRGHASPCRGAPVRFPRRMSLRRWPGPSNGIGPRSLSPREACG